MFVEVYGSVFAGIYGSSSSSREVMMGRRKLAPVQKASVRNRLGGAAAADLGGEMKHEMNMMRQSTQMTLQVKSFKK